MSQKKASMYIYDKHEWKIVLGVVFIIIGFIAIGTLMAWQMGSSDRLGSSYAQSGNLGEFIWEIIVVGLVIIGSGIIFYYLSQRHDLEKLERAGNYPALYVIGENVRTIDINAVRPELQYIPYDKYQQLQMQPQVSQIPQVPRNYGGDIEMMTLGDDSSDDSN